MPGVRAVRVYYPNVQSLHGDGPCCGTAPRSRQPEPVAGQRRAGIIGRVMKSRSE